MCKKLCFRLIKWASLVQKIRGRHEVWDKTRASSFLCLYSNVRSPSLSVVRLSTLVSN